MAPFITFPIDLGRTVDCLTAIERVLNRIAGSLEALVPPLPAQRTPVQATLADLRRTDPQTVAEVKRELDVFAGNNNVTLDSEAFVRSIIEYEREVAEAYGPDSIHELPWNKAAGGSIFRSLDLGKADRKEPAAQKAKGTDSAGEPQTSPASTADQ